MTCRVPAYTVRPTFFLVGAPKAATTSLFAWLGAHTGDGAVGALWTPGDASACADAIHRVLDRPLREQRAAARARFARWFTWEVIGARALTIYRDVMHARARASGAPARPDRSAATR
jgi:hypothetical protein